MTVDFDSVQAVERKRRLMTGKLAKSKKGHDAGCIYLIIREEDGAVWLADGKTKTVGHPKRKNKKHIQPILHLPEQIRELLTDEEMPDDDKVRRILKLYRKSCANDGKTQ